MIRIASFGLYVTLALFMVACGDDSSSSPANGGGTKISVEKTSFTDSRDGQTYKAVTIGNQVWMAQNLNFDMNSGFAYSVCFKENAENCKKYGRLYNWTAARLSCPEGWHLPTNEEFNVLFAAVGGQEKAGIKLKSATGWAEDYLNGTDDYGFSVLPAGEKRTSSSNSFDGLGYEAQFWSATEHNSYIGYYVNIQYDEPLFNSFSKDDLRSVRCLKD
jgi:uncharacterized protein (TIGR02145 family)